MPSLNTGNAILSNPIKVDSSYNVGIGGAASGSFKLQVTGNTNLFGSLNGQGAGFSGNVTIGNPSSALAQFHIYNSSAAASMLVQTNSAADYSEIAARNFNQTSTCYYRQYSSSASGTDFGASRNNLAALFSNYASNFAIGTQNGGDLILGTANTERLRITASTGAATFSNSVQAVNMSIGIAPQTDKLFVYNASGTNTGVTIQQDGTGDIFRANGNSGANRFSITQAGAATFSSTITNRIGHTIFGAAGAYTTGDNPFLGLGTTSPDTFGAINAPYGDKMKLNAYHGFEFKTSNSTASPITMMTINISGNVGIGTTSPSSTFHVRGTFGAPATTGSALNGVARLGQTSGNGGLDIGFGDPYSWLQSRNATDYSVNYNLVLQPNGGDITFGSPSASSTRNMYWVGGSSNEFQLNGGTGSNTIGSAGAAIRIGDNTSGARRFWAMQLDGSNQFATFYYNESVGWNKVGYQTTGGTWTNSDERRKENIELSNYGLNEVLQLIPKKFNFKLDERKIPNLGFIAQDVISVIPEAVQTDIDDTTEYYAMNYANLVPVLVKAIQELNQTVQNQQQQINSLINR